MNHNQPPVSCEEAMLMTIAKLGTPVIIGSRKIESVSQKESEVAQELAKTADCEGCIGCRLKEPGRMEPMTEMYNDAAKAGTLGEYKEILASRLPNERVVEEVDPSIAA